MAGVHPYCSQKFSHDQPHRDDNNHLMYNVKFTFLNGKTENYEMTHEKFRDLTDIRKKQLNTFQVDNNFINLRQFKEFHMEKHMIMIMKSNVLMLSLFIMMGQLKIMK